MKTLLSVVGAAAISACAAQAQTESKEAARVQHDVITHVQGKEGITFERHAFVAGGPDTVEFVSAEAAIAGKTVKGAPYSAEAISESTQMLADGNRITSKSSATIYRDSEGRTRRDAALSIPGMSDPPTFITINDPVAGTAYHMDSKVKIARKLPVAPEGMPMIASAPAVRVLAGSPGAHGETAPGGAMISFARTRAPQMAIGLRSTREPKTEPLGKRVIEGVEAEGTRLTLIIPAGEVGNERDIHVVTERWYSPELQTVVLSKHADPRFGETTYTLTQVKRSEPPASLFQIPSDYTVANDDQMPNVRFMRKLERK